MLYKFQQYPLFAQLGLKSSEDPKCSCGSGRPHRHFVTSYEGLLGICSRCSVRIMMCEVCGEPAKVVTGIYIRAMPGEWGTSISGAFALCEKHYNEHIVTIADSTTRVPKEDTAEDGFGTRAHLSMARTVKCPLSGVEFAARDSDPLILTENGTGVSLSHIHYNNAVLSGVVFRRCENCGAFSTSEICVRCLVRLGPQYHKCKNIGSKRIGRTIGIELECEPSFLSMKAIEASKIASSCDDHSLRGGFRVEYRSPILSEGNVDEWCHRFFGMLKANVYNRCGLHIHVGSDDWSWSDVAAAIIYCASWQNEFGRMVLPSRAMSDSPVSSGGPMMLPSSRIMDCSDTMLRSKNGLMEVLYGPREVLYDRNTGASLLRNKRANDTSNAPRYPGIINRYWWFNVHGHFHKKAPEIRLHHATTSCDQTLAWVSLWVQLFGRIIDATNVKKHPLDLVDKKTSEFYRKRMSVVSRIRVDSKVPEGINILDGLIGRMI